MKAIWWILIIVVILILGVSSIYLMNVEEDKRENQGGITIVGGDLDEYTDLNTDDEVFNTLEESVEFLE